MFNNTRHKFQQLNQEPEDVRIRAAIRLSIVIGAILIPLTLFILFPLQTKLQQARNQTDSKYASNEDSQSPSILSRLKKFTNRQADSTETKINAPQVGGAADINNQDLLIPRSNSTPLIEAKSFNPNNLPVEITP